MENEKKNFLPDDLQDRVGQFSPSEIEAAKKGNIAPLLQKLSPADRKRVETMLGDKEALQKLTQNPQVQKLMQQLKRNG